MNYPKSWTNSVNNTPLQPWLDEQVIQAGLTCEAHGDYSRWRETLEQLSALNTDKIDLSLAHVHIGESEQIDSKQAKQIRNLLLSLHPWRKGPFNIFGINVDSEWCSDTKWQRLNDSISPLQGRRVLDIGCGNGYYMLRMLGAGAAWVLGIDPTILFNMQFKALSQFISHDIAADILPLGVDQLPDRLGCFDTVFSMGVLYHRRSPIDHLYKLFSCLRPGGELVLETLVINDGAEDRLLLPEDRYAKMRNVWFIPAPQALKSWLYRCGYRDIRIVDISTTGLTEQRSTEWMKFDSLKDFLDPDDFSKTVEGLPAPTRAILVAQRPA